MLPKFTKNACFFQVCFHTVFSSILERFLISFPGARPSISLLFTMNSWGAPFFTKSEKVAKMTSQSEPKCLPKCLQKPSKIDQKTKPKNNTKNQRCWLPKWKQNGAQRRQNVVTHPTFSSPETRAKKIIIFYRLLTPLGAILLHFGYFLHQVWGSKAQISTKIRQELAKNSPRARREPAENPPRTRQEPAKNPPRIRQEPAQQPPFQNS